MRPSDHTRKIPVADDRGDAQEEKSRKLAGLQDLQQTAQSLQTDLQQYAETDPDRVEAISKALPFLLQLLKSCLGTAAVLAVVKDWLCMMLKVLPKWLRQQSAPMIIRCKDSCAVSIINPWTIDLLSEANLTFIGCPICAGRLDVANLAPFFLAFFT